MGSESRRPHSTSSSPLSPAVAGKNRNEPAAILATWTALEALSPATFNAPHDLVYGDRSRVARFEDGPLPWTVATEPAPGKQLFYSVVLGAMLMDPATEALMRVFGDDEARVRSSKKKAVAAEILLDRNGVVLAEKAISVSSFPWALPLALQLKLAELGGWPSVEEELQAGWTRLCTVWILKVNPFHSIFRRWTGHSAGWWRGARFPMV